MEAPQNCRDPLKKTALPKYPPDLQAMLRGQNKACPLLGSLILWVCQTVVTHVHGHMWHMHVGCHMVPH